MQDQVPPPAQPKKRGCFFYGCIISAVLVVVIGLSLFLAARYFMHKVSDVLIKNTDTVAVALPKSDMPADQLKQLTARVDAFQQAVQGHSNTPPLQLTSEELNALIASQPQFKDLQGKFYVTLKGDETQAQISLPMDPFAKGFLAPLKGRYLNGQGTFKVNLSGGSLFVTADSIEVKGQPLDPSIMTGLKSQNLAQGFNQGTNNAIFQDYDSLQVKDGVLIVTPKSH